MTDCCSPGVANTCIKQIRRSSNVDETSISSSRRRRQGETARNLNAKVLFFSFGLIILFLREVNAKSNLLHSENVFGWQRPSRQLQQQQISRSRRQSLQSSPGPTITTSPLRRSENVFGWQKRNTLPKQSRNSASERTIFNVINNNNSEESSASNRSIEKDDKSKQLNISPNIKFQPRKNELWLPWPLGHLRNDFNKFASNQREGQSMRQQQQKRLRNYYSDEGYQEPNVFEQGREWAARMLQRGESMLKGTIGGNLSNGQDAGSQDRQSGHWIKDTTTPMATASATMIKKESKKTNSRRQKVALNDDNINASNNGASDRDVLFQYLKLQASIRLRQLGYVGSDFSVHLPSASPALLLLYMLPRKQDPLRRLVKFSMTTAAVSWMHSEATKYRLLAPLPIMKGINVREPNLPPFLPEERPQDEKKLREVVVEKEKDTSSNAKKKSKGKEEDEGSKVDKNDDAVSSSSHNGWDLKSFGTISSAYRTWLEAYNSRKEQSYHQRRERSIETLLALRSSSNSTKASIDSKTGYALVTGASRGIGRAIAVELARYNIPLILVARDLEKLSAVAKDIETLYGIPCRILQADLTTQDCASRIHDATTKAGLDVDILINNAGVCTHGDLIDGNVNDALRMIQLNVGSVMELSRLYGKNMKARRRGRILFVSSMSGAMPGCPSVAVYAATKAFEKSLASSLGRELERYGVGVTCLLPGAVGETSFASASNVEDAICFHFPGYAKSPEFVAGEGIKGLMLGYPEVYPGWQNRLFVKMGLPMLPSRVSNMIGEWAWNPWQWGDTMPQRSGGIVAEKAPIVEGTTSLAAESPQHHTSSLTWKFRRSSSNQMQLPDTPKDKKKSAEKSTSNMPTPHLYDATAANLVPKDESPTSGSGGTAILPHGEVSKEDSKESTKSKASQSQATDDEAEGNGKDDDAPSATSNTEKESTPEKGDSFFIESTGEVSPQQPSSASVLPLPPVTSNESSSPSTPMILIDKDKDPENKSMQDKSTKDDSNKNSEKKNSLNPESMTTIEMLPSMLDNQEYDFRDRRLDYAKS